MSCPTAERWFVPDEDYYFLSEDYALVNRSSNWIQVFLDRIDKVKEVRVSSYDNFYQYMRYSPRWFLETTNGKGILIYADVDQARPEHKAMVYDLNAQKPWLEEAEKHTEEASKSLIEFAKSTLLHSALDLEILTEEDVKAEMLYSIQKMGFPDELVDYLIKLEDTRIKAETLRILSGQKRYRKPRPVMILVKMLDNGDAGGWVIGYDFVQNLIIIKSFDSKHGQHPLGEAWFEKPTRDDIYTSANPHDFATTLVSEFGSEPTGDRRGFALVMSYLAGKWIRDHAKELKLPEELRTGLQKALSAMKMELKNEVFPGSDEGSEVPEPVKRNVVQREWVAQRLKILEDEDALRDVALEAKESGFETSAHNLAKYFERTVKELGQLARNPEAPLEI